MSIQQGLLGKLITCNVHSQYCVGFMCCFHMFTTW